METLDEPVITRHRLNVEQYHLMGEAGVFEPDVRVELIEGEVIDMAPIGSKHFSAVGLLTRWLVEATGSQAFISIQQPIRLDRFSEPEPDIAVLRPRGDFYASALPTSADALLVIEVADSTLAFDLRTKARLYATHGVPVYWVIDLIGRQLHVHRTPEDEAYRDITVETRPGRMAIPGLADASIDLCNLFGA